MLLIHLGDLHLQSVGGVETVGYVWVFKDLLVYFEIEFEYEVTQEHSYL